MGAFTTHTQTATSARRSREMEGLPNQDVCSCLMRLFAQMTVVVAAAVVGCTSAPVRSTDGDRGRADVATLASEADALAASRRFGEASQRYAAALAIAPADLDVAKRALGSFWRAARYDDAYVWGHRVLAREPRSLDVLFDVGVTCGFLLELDCIDSLFHRAIAIDPRFVEGYGELAFLAQARGDIEGAIGYMGKAYAVDPNDDFAVSGLAQMLIAGGQAARALSVMEPRLARNRTARAYGGRSMLTLYGWALLRTGETERANAAFDEVLARLANRERSGETTYQLSRERAAILALRGEHGAAIGAMQAAFEHGWRPYGAWTLVDPMFASVSSDPAVAALVEKMRAQVRAIRRRLGLADAGR
jgi:tetratricopeptide (TPR) repeat protein